MAKDPKFEVPICEECGSKVSSIFCNLRGEQLSELSYSKGCHYYKKGQSIFYMDTRPTGLYCINKGKVKIIKVGDEGKEQIVRLAKAGDVLGYRSLISGETYSASAEALEDSTICFIPRSMFFDLLNKNPELSLKVMQLLSGELRSAERKITDIAQKPVRERLAQTLISLSETYGYDDNEHINIMLTREDLANIVGTATETVIRLLSEFKKDDLIEIKGRKIKICNQKRLVRTANLVD